MQLLLQRMDLSPHVLHTPTERKSVFVGRSQHTLPSPEAGSVLSSNFLYRHSIEAGLEECSSDCLSAIMGLLDAEHLVNPASHNVTILRKHLANIVIQAHPHRAHVVSQLPRLELQVSQLRLIQIKLDSNLIKRRPFVDKLLKQLLLHHTDSNINCIGRGIKNLQPGKLAGDESTKRFLYFIPCVINIFHSRKQCVKLIKLKQLVVSLDHSFRHLEQRKICCINCISFAKHSMNTFAFCRVRSCPSPALADFNSGLLCKPSSCIVKLRRELLHSRRAKAHRIIGNQLNRAFVCDGEMLERFIEHFAGCQI